MTGTGYDGRPLRDGWPVGTVVVVGIAGDRLDGLSPEATEAVASADVLVGSPGHLLRAARSAPRAQPVEIGGDLREMASQVRRRAVDAGQRVCLLAAGDPGFSGITRALTRTIDRRSLRVLPAVSPVATAFARLGLSWDDATVVSTRDRPLSDAVGAVRTRRKVAVLASPGSPPESVGAALLDAGAALDLVAVCGGLDTADEAVVELDLPGLAAGRFDPDSVVVLVGPGGLPLVGWSPGGAGPGVPVPAGSAAGGWAPGSPGGGPAAAGSAADGVPDGAAPSDRSSVAAELHAVVIGKLALPAEGVLWDVGSAGGGVAVRCSLARPGLTVLAVSGVSESAGITRSVASSGAGVHVVAGHAPQVLADLPAPDRVFLDAGAAALGDVLVRLRPGGRVVAIFTALDQAAEAADLLGNLAHIGVSLGEQAPGGGWTLRARDPVFVAWGP